MTIIQSVARALQILELFDESQQSLSIKEISTKLDLNKSTVHSLLKTLKEYGYVVQNEDTADYLLGWKLYERGNMLVSQLDIKSVAAKHLKKLNSIVNETVHLVILVGKQALYIDKINGNNSLVIYSKIGKTVNLHSSAVGKVLTAFLPNEKFNQLFNQYKFQQFTKNTIMDKEILMQELEAVRERGYGYDNEENEVGIICVAMPIYDYTQQVIAAVSVSTPKIKFSKQKEKLVIKNLTHCAEEISNELGYLRG